MNKYGVVMTFTTIFPNTTPQSLKGNYKNLQQAHITACIEHGYSLAHDTVLVADKCTLEELISFYKESTYDTSTMTINAANDSEALIGINNRMKVQLREQTFDCTDMTPSELALARLTVATKTSTKEFMKKAIRQLLSIYPMVSITDTVNKVMTAKPELNENQVLSYAEWLVKKKESDILEHKKITVDLKDKNIDSMWSPLVKIKDLSKGGAFLDYSSTGTGKTERNEKIVNYCLANDLKVAVISHRVSISNSILKIDGVTHYQHYKVGEEFTMQAFNVVVNSIIKTNFGEFLTSCDVIILEEGSQVLGHIATGTVKQRDRVYDQLKTICKNAKSFIITDADANDSTLQFMKEARPDSFITLMHNRSNFEDKKILMKDYDQVLGEIEEIAGTEPIMIATDNKKQVNRIAARMRRIKPDLKVLTIHSDNIKDKHQDNFLNDPDLECEKYDLIIYSPAITSTLSITNDRFKKHYGLFQGTITSNTAIQMLRRNRPCQMFIVAVKAPYEYKSTDAEEIQGDKPSQFDIFSAKIEAAENYDKNNSVSSFYFMAKHIGFTVEVDNSSDMIEAGKTANRSGIMLESAEYKTSRLNAVAATKEMVNEAEENGSETTENIAASIDRAKMEKALCKTNINRDDIAIWDRGAFSGRIKNIESMGATREMLVGIDSLQTGPNRDRDFYTVRHDAFNMLFETLGIDKATGQGEFTVHQCNELLTKLMETRKEFNRAKTGQTLSKVQPSRGTRKVLSIIESMGLTAYACGENADRQRVYSIDALQFTKMMERVAVRAGINVSSIKA
jgi:hypothetical protein